MRLTPSNYSEETKPFDIAGIKVYSLEEAVYFCYINWHKTYNDIFTGGFADWVEYECRLSEEAEKIRGLIDDEDIPHKLNSFFAIMSLEPVEIKIGSDEIKIKGDNFFKKGKLIKALKCYESIAEKNDDVLNNTAVCYMKLKSFDAAAEMLKQTDYMSNRTYFYNLIEAIAFSERFNDALELIDKAPFEDYRNTYYRAVVLYRSRKYKYALECIENADYDTDGMFLLADIYIALNRISDAEQLLKNAEKTDKTIIKLSEIYSMRGNILAVKIIEKELVNDNKNINLWLACARAYRLSRNFTLAQGAAFKAKTLNPDDNRVYLEYAMIYKAKGDIKEYEKMLDVILANYKVLYRDMPL